MQLESLATGAMAGHGNDSGAKASHGDYGTEAKCGLAKVRSRSSQVKVKHIEPRSSMQKGGPYILTPGDE